MNTMLSMVVWIRMTLIDSYILMLVPSQCDSEGLWDVSLLEELNHWVWSLRFQKPTSPPFLSSAHRPPQFPACGPNVSPQLLLQHYACCVSCFLQWLSWTLIFWNWKPIHHPQIKKVALITVSYHNNTNILRHLSCFLLFQINTQPMKWHCLYLG